MIANVLSDVHHQQCGLNYLAPVARQIIPKRLQDSQAVADILRPEELPHASLALPDRHSLKIVDLADRFTMLDM
ncbi:MAG: hypothetical protein ACREYC_25720, partial [Gammaproteobacteria bacterium]